MINEIEKIEQLAIKNNWCEFEKDHAIDNLHTEYGKEYILELKNGKQIHTNAYPEDCDYVRVTQDGYEIAYWVSDEWRDDPQIVMGAFLGALK